MCRHKESVPSPPDILGNFFFYNLLILVFTLFGVSSIGFDKQVESFIHHPSTVWDSFIILKFPV